jgi:hypothetical protein
VLGAEIMSKNQMGRHARETQSWGRAKPAAGALPLVRSISLHHHCHPRVRSSFNDNNDTCTVCAPLAVLSITVTATTLVPLRSGSQSGCRGLAITMGKSFPYHIQYTHLTLYTDNPSPLAASLPLCTSSCA